MSAAKTSSPVKASTQLFLEIEEIKDDIVLMRDFSASIVIEVGTVNFWLLSQEEQGGMIAAYGNLLNSLSFPVQILVLSRNMNVSSYLEYLTGRIEKQENETMKKQLASYTDFIKNIIKKTTVLEKRFFFAIPFSVLELGVSGAGSTKGLSKDYVISRAKTSLYPKRDNLLRLLAKIGLKSTVLQRQQLVELYYNLYNPSSTGRKLATIENYTDVVMTS